MTWLTRIPCPFCRLRGYEDAAHQAIHDGPAPPTNERRWGVRCPCTSRLQLVDPTRYEWEPVSKVIGPSVEIHGAPVLLEW